MRSHVPSGPEEPFASLLTAALAGGQWAYERLYRSLAPAVAGYLRVQGAPDPDDLTSEVFERAFSALATFSGDEAQFRSWVFTIAHHRLTDERRRTARRPVRADAEVPDTVPAGVDVEEEAARRLATQRVHRLCDTLAPDQRDVLLLRMLADLTIDDIASALGKTPGAVKALQRRGLAALRRQLAGVAPLSALDGLPAGASAALPQGRQAGPPPPAPVQREGVPL